MRRVAVIGNASVASKKAHAINVRVMQTGFRALQDLGLVNSVLGIAKVSRGGFFRLTNASRTKWQGSGLVHQKRLGRLLLSRDTNFVYARSFEGAEAAVNAGIRTVIETHAPPWYLEKTSRDWQSLVSSTSLVGIVTISPFLKSALLDITGASPEKIQVLGDPVDLELFNVTTQIPDAVDGIVRYAGHLYEYKGISTLLTAASYLPDVAFEILGGKDKDVRYWKRKFSVSSNVSFLGWKSHAEVAETTKQSGLLVLPNEAWHESALWTSPMKLGEYLSTGNPLVVSDIPAHRYWLESGMATWFEPGNPESLAQAILEALRVGNRESAQRSRHTLAQSLGASERASAILGMG